MKYADKIADKVYIVIKCAIWHICVDLVTYFSLYYCSFLCFSFVFCSYCGVKNPSWADIGHFVNFLEIQLRLCEKSIFCNQELVGDVLIGFKNFVVKFMIRMSRVSTVVNIAT